MWSWRSVSFVSWKTVVHGEAQRDPKRSRSSGRLWPRKNAGSPTTSGSSARARAPAKLGEALRSTEPKAAALRRDLQAYEASAQAMFKAPPVEWIAHRLMALRSVLEAEPARSGLELRRVLGLTRLVPIAPQVEKSYYQAETALQVLDLVKAPEDGSTWLHWWTQSQPIRTVAEVPFWFGVVDTKPSFVYLQIAEKASELRRLGMSACAIARVLRVSDKTVTKALWRANAGLQKGR